ncbi:MAG: undecaprenyl-diphosphate phosphatase [Candidatus Saccharibacteria bacterium]|nr:undecaprenyl-diphosphate phosphatase [Candidatus Saccharibacteria bacterium]
MSIFEAIFLGLVQGFTEFIPVSSSGHLVLAQSLFGSSIDHLLIQALDFGTTLALIIYFWPRLMDLARQVFVKKDYRLARNIIITCIPAGLLGLLLANFIETSKVLVNPLVVAIMLALVGVLMIVVDKLPKKSKKTSGRDLSPKRALVIGIAQSFALIPGVSRSGSTILASRIMGLASKPAAEYSFMVSIPIMLGLLAKLLLKESDRTYMLTHLEPIIVGNIAAFISGMIAIKFMLGYLENHGLSIFGWYRIGVASIVIVVLLVQ